MTDKEKIRNIIELFIAWNGETEVIDIANIDSAVEFISSSLQKEPVSEELREEVKKFFHSDNNLLTHIPYSFKSTVEFAYHFANWQKEQMIKDAIDAEVLENYDGKVIKYDETILDEKLSDCKVFDKVKVIITKED